MTKKLSTKFIKFQGDILCISKETPCGKSLNHMIHKLKVFFCMYAFLSDDTISPLKT